MAASNVRVLKGLEALAAVEAEFQDRKEPEQIPVQWNPAPIAELPPDRVRRSFLRVRACTKCGKEVAQMRFANPFVCEECRKPVYREARMAARAERAAAKKAKEEEQIDNDAALGHLYDQLEQARARERRCQEEVLAASQDLRQAAYKSGQIRAEIRLRGGRVSNGDQ